MLNCSQSVVCPMFQIYCLFLYFSEVEDKGEETEQNKSQGDTEKKDDTNKEDSSIDNPQEDMEEENEVEEGFEDEL